MRSVVWFGDTLVADLLAPSRGSVTLDAPLGFALQHTHVRTNDLAHLADHCRQNPADLVLVSVGTGFATAGTATSDSLAACLHAAISALPASTHVYVILPSTLIAATSPPGVVDPLTIELHRRILAAVQVAASTGISTIDIDRLVAETGGRASVLGPLEYTDDLLDIVRDEIVRILDDSELLSSNIVPAAQRDAGHG